MRYLFFDTESANCYGNVYKMCEWGSIITDEAFNPSYRKDILMNPGDRQKFNLIGRKGGRDLVLAHPYEQYRKEGLFLDHYDNIKYALTQKGIMIFLWAAENDIQAVLDQCKRYRLKKFSFVSYDVQTIFKSVFPEVNGMPSLEKAMDYLELSKEGITLHRPDDDAWVTALILKTLCQKTGKSVHQLIEECPKCRMESISTYDNLQKRHEANEMRKRCAKAFEEIFNKGTPEDAPFDKCFTVSNQIKRHSDQLLGPIMIWIDRGYFLKRSLKEVPYAVYFDEAEKEYLAGILDLKKLKLVSVAEFDEMTKNN